MHVVTFELLVCEVLHLIVFVLNGAPKLLWAIWRWVPLLLCVHVYNSSQFLQLCSQIEGLLYGRDTKHYSHVIKIAYSAFIKEAPIWATSWELWSFLMKVRVRNQLLVENFDLRMHIAKSKTFLQIIIMNNNNCAIIMILHWTQCHTSYFYYCIYRARKLKYTTAKSTIDCSGLNCRDANAIDNSWVISMHDNVRIKYSLYNVKCTPKTAYTVDLLVIQSPLGQWS